MVEQAPDLRIGVALSGGGAAGLAHVGVLEELAAAGIPIHCVAGTSAGAMVGAAYAADRLDAFRDTMCALTRRRVLSLFDPTWPRSGLLEGRRSLELIRPHVGDASRACRAPSRRSPPTCVRGPRWCCGRATSWRRSARASPFRASSHRSAGGGVCWWMAV